MVVVALSGRPDHCLNMMQEKQWAICCFFVFLHLPVVDLVRDAQLRVHAFCPMPSFETSRVLDAVMLDVVSSAKGVHGHAS